MARNRASMREGPLAELFRATEAAQRQQEDKPAEESSAEATKHIGAIWVDPTTSIPYCAVLTTGA